ncbi:DUF4145 domain-containing protein [Pyxidicoccus trucidator]|uniref:DUF4145 domain-containing protein n=1 Tax=Pyxidicoccus trucidator TaxID=2709662 RepID=UPI0013DACD79|nr:DUF4145 domain-containing protein [Pyxidicoccus trucidator]
MRSDGPKDSGFSQPGGDAAAWLSQLPEPTRTFWREVCQSLEAGSFTLVAHGTRTLVGRVAQDLLGETGPFAQALQALYTHGIISKRDRERLELAVKVGNAAVHKRLNLDQKGARTLARILEGVLRTAYLPEEDVNSLRSILRPSPTPGG